MAPDFDGVWGGRRCNVYIVGNAARFCIQLSGFEQMLSGTLVADPKGIVFLGKASDNCGCRMFDIPLQWTRQDAQK